MKNISKNLSPLEEHQSTFDELLGKTFFNKDLETPSSFGIRKAKIEHVDDCECLNCEEERNLDRK